MIPYSFSEKAPMYGEGMIVIARDGTAYIGRLEKYAIYMDAEEEETPWNETYGVWLRPAHNVVSHVKDEDGSIVADVRLDSEKLQFIGDAVWWISITVIS